MVKSRGRLSIEGDSREYGNYQLPPGEKSAAVRGGRSADLILSVAGDV